MDKIARIHEKVLDFLLKYRRHTPTLYFIPRRKNNLGRLEKGYWFIGNEEYLQVTFWNASGALKKLHYIGFIIKADKTSCVEMYTEFYTNLEKHFKRIASELGFTKHIFQDKWFRKYEGTNYLTHLKDFIEHEKIYIDNYIVNNSPINVSLIKSMEFDKYMNRIITEKRKKIQSEPPNEKMVYEEKVLFAGRRKNTDKRRKRTHTVSVYDPYHDMMQNALFDLLSHKTNEYSFVQIERDRVDLKAQTHAGEWHYFEIKTDTPKLSIRKALGQVMEYAYFPCAHRATRLYVVGDEAPSAAVISYLELIRTSFNIPVYYCYFVLEIGFLSGEY